MLQLEMREKELIKYVSRLLSVLRVGSISQPKCCYYSELKWQILYSFIQHSLREVLCPAPAPVEFQLSGVAAELLIEERALDQHLQLHPAEWLREGVLISRKAWRG